MQAILTKWIPSTDTKPFRIKAWTEHLNRLCSLTLSLAEVDQAFRCLNHRSSGHLTNQQRHQYVVEKLLLKNGWDHVGIVGSGEILKGFAFICINAYDSQSTIESSEHGITSNEVK